MAMIRIVSAVALLALGGCADPVVSVPGVQPDAGRLPALAPSPPPAPVVGPAPAFGDGSYVVGAQIAPGVYRTAGALVEGIPVCSWHFFVGDRLVATGSASGPVSIGVEPVYSVVEFRGCLDWRRVP